MIIQELLQLTYEKIFVESVFDVLDSISPTETTPMYRDILMALVMYVLANSQKPGILQLNGFYASDNTALYNELKRLSTNHPEQFEIGRNYVAQHGILAAKRLVSNFFSSRHGNADMLPQPSRPGPQLPQRPIGGDRGRMKIAGR